MSGHTAQNVSVQAQRLIDHVREQKANTLYLSLQAKCRAVEKDASIIGVYSTGEQCAVALILNNPRLLPHSYTWLDASDRVGEVWLSMCLQIQRNGWT